MLPVQAASSRGGRHRGGAKVVAEYEFFREERFFALKFRSVWSDNVFEFHLTKVF